MAGVRRPDVTGRTRHLLRTSFVVGVRSGLDLEQRVVPSAGASGDRLCVPVRTFDEADLQWRGQGVGGPPDHSGQIVGRVVSIRLDDATEIRPVREPPADLTEQRKGRVLGLVVLGIEMDGCTGPLGRLEDRFEAIDHGGNTGRHRDIGDLGREGRRFHRQVDPRDATPWVRLEQRGAGQSATAASNAASASPTRRGRIGIRVGHRLLTDEVQRVGESRFPKLPEAFDHVVHLCADDELAGHLTDPERRRSGRQSVATREMLGQAEPGTHRRRAVRMLEVLGQVVGGVGRADDTRARRPRSGTSGS